MSETYCIVLHIFQHITKIYIPYRPVYKTHFFPPIFVSKSGCILLDFFKFKDTFKSREIDPKRQYFRHPVYGYVITSPLLSEVTVLFVCM